MQTLESSRATHDGDRAGEPRQGPRLQLALLLAALVACLLVSPYTDSWLVLEHQQTTYLLLYAISCSYCFCEARAQGRQPERLHHHASTIYDARATLGAYLQHLRRAHALSILKRATMHSTASVCEAAGGLCSMEPPTTCKINAQVLPGEWQHSHRLGCVGCRFWRRWRMELLYHLQSR